jgi:hypothetical protein
MLSNKRRILLPALLLCALLTACATDGGNPADPTASPAAAATLSGDEPSTGDSGQSGAGITAVSVKYDDEDLNADWSSADAILITLNGDSVACEGEGVSVAGTVVTLTAQGDYVVSGVLDNGQIIVNTQDDGVVRIIFNGASITCQDSAPVYILNAGKAVVTLADGTQNSLTDGPSYTLTDIEANEPSATLFSNDDLTVNGGGSLTVTGNYKNGIQSKDDLIFAGGALVVNAVSDGIKGKDSVVIRDSDIAVTAGKNGISASNAENDKKGYVVIEGGTVTVTADNEAIQAASGVTVSGGVLNLTSGQDAIQAGAGILISGGTFEITSGQDAVQAASGLAITGAS